MTDVTTFLVTFLVAAPALSGVVILLGRMLPRRAAAWAVSSSALSAAAASSLLWQRPSEVAKAWSWAPDLHLELSWRLEVATLAIALLVAGIGLLVLQYAGRYLAASHSNGRTIALLAGFESAMLGLVLADNLLLLYVFWELTGLCSFFLIKSDKSKSATGLRAASQALLVTAAGGLSMLIGLLYLAAATGTSSLAVALQADLEPAVRNGVFAFLLPAVLTKSAQMPAHFWLPGAMAAPTPVSAYLHSATMVKAGIILLLYFYPLLGASPLWTAVLLPVGAATCVWGSLQALRQPDIKLLMAWSTVSQLGLIVLTIGLGTDVAVRAAILHLFAHAVFKAGLFMTVGGVDHASHTRSLLELGGLWRRLPLLSAVAAVLAGSMAGIPPLAGFLSKELILKKAMMAELWTHSFAVGAIVLGSVGTVAYSSRFFFETFAGHPRSEGASRAERLSLGLLLAPLSLAGVTLISGLAAPWVDRFFLEPVAFSIVGRPLEVKSLSLWYGINAALVLSLLIVMTGYLVDRWLGLRFLGRTPVRGWQGPDLFDRWMQLSQQTGAILVRLLAGASPRLYLGIAIACGLVPATTLMPKLAEVAWSTVLPAGLVVVLALVVLLAFLLVAQRALPKVLILTAIGFGVAILFRLANGPDLMLTQLLVEVLVTIFFALALWSLPSRIQLSTDEGGRGWQGTRMVLAVTSGLGAAAWVAAGTTGGDGGRVANFAREVAPVIAKGDNLVNVVLTDVRSLDTLMETFVVVLGGLGVVGLLKGLERADLRRVAGDGPIRAPVTTGLLPGLAKAILPIGSLFALMLLTKGHNDPGGGFVAGLSLGVTIMLALVAFGPVGLERRIRLSLSSLALLGCLLIVVSGWLGWIAGQQFLTQFHGELSLPGISMALHTTLLFDIGVMMAVAGSIGAAGLAFWTESVRQPGGRQA